MITNSLILFKNSNPGISSMLDCIAMQYLLYNSSMQYYASMLLQQSLCKRVINQL